MLKNHFFQKIKNIFLTVFVSKKSSFFLNIRTTLFDQSSLVQPIPKKYGKIWKNLKNNYFFKKSENFKERKILMKNFNMRKM